MKVCDECGGKHYAKGKCRIHYKMPSQLNPKPIKSKVTSMSWDQYQAKKKSKAKENKPIEKQTWIAGEGYHRENEIWRPNENKKPKPKRLEEKSVQELMKLADIVFAKWIKKRDSLTDGTFKCISCNRFHSSKIGDAGHFYSRRFSAVRYHEDNVHLECQMDNRGNDNHLDGYKVNLEAKIGSERLKWLQDNYNKGHKWQREELIELIKKYKV